MHYIERFWNHLRNSDFDDIFFSIIFGFIALVILVALVGVVWALVEWLGVFVVVVPFVIIGALLIVYGIGHFIVERIDV